MGVIGGGGIDDASPEFAAMGVVLPEVLDVPAAFSKPLVKLDGPVGRRTVLSLGIWRCSFMDKDGLEI